MSVKSLHKIQNLCGKGNLEKRTKKVVLEIWVQMAKSHQLLQDINVYPALTDGQKVSSFQFLVETHARKMICALNASSMPCVCRWKGYNAVAQTVFVERITGNLQKLPFQPSLPASLSLEHGAKVFLCRNECKISKCFLNKIFLLIKCK